jgi:LysW-gamma-L-lysine/LysW-L-ornithine aminotransferase
MSVNRIIQKKSLVSTYPDRGLCLVEGRGCALIDEKGKEYLDMMSNYGVSLLGYGNTEINNKISSQLKKLTVLHSSFSNDTRARAGQKLIKRVRCSGINNLSRVYWGNSGAEAVEAAVKFALLASGKKKILAAKNGYHGKTLGALSCTSSSDFKYQKPFEGQLAQVDFFDFGDIENVKKLISEQVGVVIIEPIQGEGGVIVPPENFLPALSRICREKGVILIIDEIQTGLGRTGKFLNLEKYLDGSFNCDIICLAKGLGGGLPVSATLVSEAVNSKIIKTIHTSTFGGNPLSLAGVEAFLDYLDSNHTLEKSLAGSEHLFNELVRLRKKYVSLVTEIRGEGYMIGIEFSFPSGEIIKKFQEKKILVAPAGKNTVRLLPPIIISNEEIDRFILALEEILTEINQ